jgi:hypothetical protein
MGAPIPLGALEFRISRPSIICFRADEFGLAILTKIAAALRKAEYDPTRPKHGKADDVRLRCIHRLGYIDLVLSFEQITDEGLAFSLEARGFTRYHNYAVIAALRATWTGISRLTDRVIREQFSADEIRSVGPTEIDACYIAKNTAH